MATKYILRNTNLVDFDYLLSTTTATSASLVVGATNGAGERLYTWISDSADPNLTNWNSDGTSWSLQFNVTSANSALRWNSWSVIRYNSDLSSILDSASETKTLVLSSTGLKTGSITKDFGTVGATDRLAIRLAMESIATHGGNPSVQIQTNIDTEATGSFATVPFPASTSGSLIKFYNGSTWESKPLKRWNGSEWVSATLKVYNGSTWDII